MPRRRRTQARITGSREALAIAATLGATARAARLGKRRTLIDLARVVGISASRLSELERGLGANASLETWAAIGAALDRPIAIAFSRPLGNPVGPRDAGHLEIQEHLLHLARATRRTGTFEVPTQPIDPSRSTDVGISDQRQRARILAECWNTFGDLGAAVRSTRRKEQEVAGAWPDDRVATVWVVRASASNRALFARYPHIIEAAFPGSSRAWVRALAHGSTPPMRPGIVWFDPSTGRLVPRRRRRSEITPNGE